MNNIHYYKPSGKFSPIIIAYLFLSVLVIVPLLTIAYAYSIAYMPYRILNIAVFAVAALILNVFPYLFLQNSKVRNNAIGVIFHSIIFICFYYLQWSAWFYYILQDIGIDVITLPQVSNTILPDVFELSLHPSLMWKYATEIISFWSGITWAIELLILGWLLSILEGMLNDPFSEFSNKWHDEQNLTVETVAKEELISAISNKDYKWFNEIKNIINVSNDSYSKLTIFKSPTFDNYLSLVYYEAVIDTNGKPDFNDKKLITNIAINKEITEIILDLTTVNSVKKIDIVKDKQKLITEKEEIFSEVISKTIVPENIITTPEIKINANEGKATRRTLGSIVMLIFGIGLLTLGITEGFIFGGLLLLGSLLSLISKALKEEDNSFAFIINPTYLHVSSFITDIGKNEIIPLNEIKEVTNSVSRDGEVTLTLIFNSIIINDETYLEIDVELADIDWVTFENKLKLFINKSVEERKELVNNWYTLLKK